jgi:transcriptional regulator with XRE-family HTH domain
MKILSRTKSVGPRLSDRIRMARSAAKLSQAELATRVGVTPGAVAQWESPSGTKPGTERLEAIATVTGAVFEWLAIGKGDPRRRRKTRDDSTPALTLGDFAQDFTEEVLLDRFRRLSPQARGLLSDFLDVITSRRR